MKKRINNHQRSTIKKVMNYIRRYWGYLGMSIVLAAVTVALTLYLPVLTGRAVDLILEKGVVDFAGILAILKKMAVIILLTAVAQWIMNACNNKITYNIIRDIRKEAFEKIERLPLKYIDGHSYGEIVSRVIADVDQFADGLLMGFTQFFTGIVTILGTLIFMLTISVKITVAVVVITPVSLLVASFIAKKTFSMFKLQSETRGEQTAFIEEMIGNQKVVQAFSHEDEALEKFDEINGRLQKCSLRAIFFSSITNPATRFVNSLVYAVVGVVGAFTAIAGGISVGQLSARAAARHRGHHDPVTARRQALEAAAQKARRFHDDVLGVERHLRRPCDVYRALWRHLHALRHALLPRQHQLCPALISLSCALVRREPRL